MSCNKSLSGVTNNDLVAVVEYVFYLGPPLHPLCFWDIIWIHTNICLIEMFLISRWTFGTYVFKSAVWPELNQMFATMTSIATNWLAANNNTIAAGVWWWILSNNLLNHTLDLILNFLVLFGLLESFAVTFGGGWGGNSACNETKRIPFQY